MYQPLNTSLSICWDNIKVNLNIYNIFDVKGAPEAVQGTARTTIHSCPGKMSLTPFPLLPGTESP